MCRLAGGQFVRQPDHIQPIQALVTVILQCSGGMKTQQRTAPLPEGGRHGTGKVDLAIEGHEQLYSLQLRVARGKRPTFLHELIGQVFDGVA